MPGGSEIETKVHIVRESQHSGLELQEDFISPIERELRRPLSSLPFIWEPEEEIISPMALTNRPLWIFVRESAERISRIIFTIRATLSFEFTFPRFRIVRRVEYSNNFNSQNSEQCEMEDFPDSLISSNTFQHINKA